MFVLFKEDGRFYIRPMLIGFIKNNITRRVLMTLCVIPVLIATVLLGVTRALTVGVVDVIRAIAFPVVDAVKHPFWKYHVWNKPRSK